MPTGIRGGTAKSFKTHCILMIVLSFIGLGKNIVSLVPCYHCAAVQGVKQLNLHPFSIPSPGLYLYGLKCPLGITLWSPLLAPIDVVSFPIANQAILGNHQTRILLGEDPPTKIHTGYQSPIRVFNFRM